MNTVMKAALLTLAFAASFSAGAKDLSVSDMNDLPISQVAIVHSLAGEGLNAFVKRVAPQFVAFTATTGYEACGMIGVRESDGVTNGAFSITIGTVGSHIGCQVGPVEAGFVSMNRTVHSHPQSHSIRLSAVDMKVRGTPAGKLRTEYLDNCHFSPQDYSAPGFLISCGKIQYQHGVGTAKEI